MAFSGADIASAINANEAISVVQSGDVLFTLIRTEKTSSSADQLCWTGTLKFFLTNTFKMACHIRRLCF